MTVLAALAAGASVAPLACGTDGSPAVGTTATTPAPKALGGATTPHAIHVLIHAPDGVKQLDFGPADRGASAVSAANTLKRPAVTVTPGGSGSGSGGSVVATGPTVADPGPNVDATAWALVQRAAYACGLQPMQYVDGSTSLPPWSAGDGSETLWFIYNGNKISRESPLPADCADRVYLEQNLVCIADQLGAIADAVGDVVWPALSAVASTPYEYGVDDASAAAVEGDFYQEWDIPPQADADRFIVRDLAIHTLGMIPVIDSYTDILDQSCATSFAQVASGTLPVDPTANMTTIDNVFGAGLSGLVYEPTLSASQVPEFPPSTAPYVGNMPTIAGTALDIEAQILRSGGRLLHDLIRRDVYSDMAAAAKTAAQTADPVAGNQAEWGQLNGSSLYGTLSHAGRVLLGRWELGDPATGSGIPSSVADPECEGISELNLLPSAFGTDYLVRPVDPTIRTAGEQTAVQLVERAGIVVPACAIASSPSSLKQALIDQLVLEEAAQNGLPLSTTPSPILVTAFTNALATVSDAELAFAFQRALNTWSLLTNTANPASSSAEVCVSVADPTGATPWPAGLVPATATSGQLVLASSVAPLDGIVVAGGIGRARLSTDPMGRAAGMTEASQCAETTTAEDTAWDEWGNPLPALAADLSAGQFGELPPAVFQDAFHIGQAFERRLNLLQTVAGPGDSQSVALGALVELRSWAGATIVHAWPQANQQGFVVRVGGMSYTNDFGIPYAAQNNTLSATDVTAIQNAIGFVYGPPWVAECAAGSGKNCPGGLSGFQQSYVAHAPPLDVTSTYTATGVLNNVFEMTVPVTGPSNFAPVIPTPSAPGENHLYMVLLHDPARPSGQGRVMGTISLRESYELLCTGSTGCHPNLSTVIPKVTSFVDAPMQRELVEDALDIGSWVGARPPSIGEPSTAAPSGSCVDGVPRNIFVPLDNELVSGTQTYEDSWQAYLAQAQSAAQTADTLGQQLIADDLQISENEQAAQEQLANICGDFASLSNATVGPNGQITAGAEDPTTQDCLSEPITDVAFLGNALPVLIPATGDQTCAIKQQLNCPPVSPCSYTLSTAANTPPSAVALCQKKSLSASYLNLVHTKSTDGVGATPSNPGPGLPLSDECTDLLLVSPSVRTGFSASDFLADSQKPGLGIEAVKAAANQLQLHVDFNDQWTVTYGSSTNPIMSSDPATPALWPSCLRGGLAACKATLPSGAAVNPVSYTMAPLWSSTFRDCTSWAGPLGTCDGDAASELNLIKWRVTQAMWMLAAMNGVLPADMFNQPIPAVFTESFLGQPSYSQSMVYYPTTPATYYPGTVVDGQLMATDGNTIGDKSTLATIATISPAFSAGIAVANNNNNNQVTIAPNEIPFWYREIYSPAYSSLALHVQASNNAEVFAQCTGMAENSPFTTDFLGLDWTSAGPHITNPFGPSSCPTTSTGVTTPLSSILSRASAGLDGIKCDTNWGEPEGSPSVTDPAAGGQPWYISVASAKLGLDPAVTSTGANILPSAGLGYGYGWDKSFNEGWETCGIGAPVLPFSLTKGQMNDCDVSNYSNYIAYYSYYPWSQGYGAYNPPQTPHQWQPSVRALSFAGFGAAPDHTCGATTLLLQAAALACTPDAATVALQTVTLEKPPQVTTLDDVPELEAWLGLVQTSMTNAVSNVYVQSVPTRVVTDLQAGTVGAGNLGGTKGQAILTMEQQLHVLSTSWIAMARDLASIGTAIAVADANVQVASAQEQTTDDTLALQTIQTEGAMAEAFGQFLVTITAAAGASVGTLGGSNAVDPAAAIELAAQLLTGSAELNQLQVLAGDAKVLGQDEETLALAQLDSTTGPLWADVQTQIDNLRGAVAQVDASGQAILQQQNQAAYQLALGTGSYFVTLSDGTQAPIPVNVVLQRQASATEQRYQTALTNAKTLAYMARRAIEQRIGMPLLSLTQNVGPIEAPASWADDLCSLQGVNYAALSTADSGVGSAQDQAAISQFADGWIGDYVTKLNDFVTYYNVQYPSHQGDDNAVLSLRDDILGPSASCTVQAPNVLLNSGDLTATSTAAWQVGACAPGASKCLTAVPGFALAAPTGGPWDPPTSTGATAPTDAPATTTASGVTWLVDEANADTAEADAGPDAGEDGGDDAGVSALTGNMVTQLIPQLAVGSYVLSWWDQARDATGNVVWAGATTTPPSTTLPSTTLPSYVAEVFDSNGHSVAIYDQPPYTPPPLGNGAAPALWSARHVLTFTVTNAGSYTVAFAASTPDEAFGSVAIADVQLEPSSNGQPSTYVPTTTTTMVSGLDCPMTTSDFLAAFTHTCDPGGQCHYDLGLPFVIDTASLSGTSIGGKLAPGNFNYRQQTIALNLVGTSVHDCSHDSTPNCYGSGYVQYDLTHDASNAGILGYDGNARAFDFGSAKISGGKALAAEQNITMPVSSNDESLLSQAGIEHVEFDGRPLDGTYYLRIWDSLDLNWSALEDVQLVLGYEYWSQIQTTTAFVKPRLKRAPLKPIFAPRRAHKRR